MGRYGCSVIHVLVFLVGVCGAQSCPDPPNLGGVIAGCIFGTLAFVGLVIAIIALVIWLRRNKGNKEKKPRGAGVTGHDNPNFQSDETDGRNTDNAEKGYAGYVKCKEYESPNKNKQNSGNPEIHNSSSVETKLNGNGPCLQKNLVITGSRGSLNETSNNDSEVMTVEFQSQDIIGLGFNVAGNMREGIYISQIHNRGPAGESGKVKIGDRILDISVSCENMVYEDALHILSYASPYPVKLRIRRTTANDPLDKPGKEVQSNLLHPLYRSSSMDDLSRIGKDGQSPGVHVINEDLQQKSVTVEVSHEKVASPRLDIPHMPITTRDLTDGDNRSPGGSASMENLHTNSAEVIEVSIPGDAGINARCASLDTIPLSSKEVTKSEDFCLKSVSVGELNVTESAPPVPQGGPPPVIPTKSDLEDSILPDEEETCFVQVVSPELSAPYSGLTEEDKLDVLRLSYEDTSSIPREVKIEEDGDIPANVVVDETITPDFVSKTETSYAAIQLSVDTDQGKDFDPELGVRRLSNSSSDEGISSPHMCVTTTEVVIESAQDSSVEKPIEVTNEVQISNIQSGLNYQPGTSEICDHNDVTLEESAIEVIEQEIVPSKMEKNIVLDVNPNIPLLEVDRSEEESCVVIDVEPTFQKRDSSDEEDKGFVDVDLVLDKSAPQSPAQKEVEEVPIEPLIVTDKSEATFTSTTVLPSLKPEDFAYSSPISRLAVRTSTIESENSQDMALKDDENIPLETACESKKLDIYADDTVKAVLKDYFSDSPGLMEELGLSPAVQTNAMPQEEYEVDSLDSEDGAVVRTGSYNVQGSLSSHESSRTSSPQPEQKEEEFCLPSVLDSAKPKEWVLESPQISKKSTGGLSFDISTDEYEEMPTEVKPKERGPPQGGTAFYVNIDENAFHAVPALAMIDNGENSPDEIPQ